MKTANILLYLFYLYKQAALEGRLPEVIQKMEQAAQNHASSTSAYSSSQPMNRDQINHDEDLEVEDYEIP